MCAQIYGMEKLFIPLFFGGHCDGHWAMACINWSKMKVEFYDSYYDASNDAYVTVTTNLQYFIREFTSPPPYQEFAPIHIIVPQQGNIDDCGVFALKFADYASRNEPMTFSQENIPGFRKAMLEEFVEGVVR